MHIRPVVHEERPGHEPEHAEAAEQVEDGGPAQPRLAQVRGHRHRHHRTETSARERERRESEIVLEVKREALNAKGQRWYGEYSRND